MYELKNSRNGEKAVYKTTVDITKQDGIITFVFTAENTQYYCPRSGYNKIHSVGDACEILIGSDPNRRWYYEIELSPANDLMLAKMEYKGKNENGRVVLGVNLVDDCFVTSTVQRTEKGYVAQINIPEKEILTGDGEIYFNAYRLETDGGEMEKHLFALNPTLCKFFHTPDKYVYLKDFVKEK